MVIGLSINPVLLCNGISTESDRCENHCSCMLSVYDYEYKTKEYMGMQTGHKNCNSGPIHEDSQDLTTCKKKGGGQCGYNFESRVITIKPQL
jgi:hypothetical protein